jgi:glycosyltransferase involved in cell wall biosynthesis
LSVAARRQRIVVATGDELGERMAGPGIRAWHIAGALAVDHDVRLVSTAGATRQGDGFDVAHADDDDLRRLIEWCDVFVFQGWVLSQRPFLTRSDKVLVADVYDPMHLEQLEQARAAGAIGRIAAVGDCTGVLNEQLLRADWCVCASEKQRDFWLGHLAALGRVNPATYDDDPSLRRLIDVVPFGLPDEPPTRRPGVGIRGLVPGIAEDDKVIVWGGGIYAWFDAATTVRAIAQVREAVPNVRLLFMGTQHPNAENRSPIEVEATRQLAIDLGLWGEHVFFNDGWVPYADRASYLLDADVGISTHHAHIETAFSFRTRLLDYLWAGLPIVTTGGDALAELVADEGLGAVVGVGDVDALAAALVTLLLDDAVNRACRARVLDVAPRYRWQNVLAPLLAFCADPRRAPDLLDADVRRRAIGPAVAARPRTGWRADAHRVADLWHERGPVEVVRGVGRRLRRTVRGDAPGGADGQ